MTSSIPRPKADRTRLRQIIAGMPEGVIIIDPDQTLAWANEAALAMHGVESLRDLRATVSEYRQRFELRYRNRRKVPPGDHPVDRVVAGEALSARASGGSSAIASRCSAAANTKTYGA